MKFQPEGVFVALWTPTNGNGRLLRREFTTHVRFLLQHGVHGFMPLGSTGEFLHLTPQQRKALLKKVVSLAGDRPVIANISDIRPAVVADLGRFAREIGASAVSVLPPYYYQLLQQDLVEFFVRAGAAAKLPLVLYNYPERTGNRIELDTIAAVADRVPLAAIKHSGSDFNYHVALVKLGKEKGFSVLTGADTRLPEAMALGATGCISGLANAVPDLLVAVFAATRAKEEKRLRALVQQMSRVGTAVGAVPFPLNMAAAMEARDLPVGEPKQVVSPATRQRYAAMVEELRTRYREWKLI
ncbi:MAG: dihydrodipicolinate synthase family protein [Verrucomicrobia bacterium]|nr:dihydrodipicolinate synthase family protein [Verrucomicrobiota bacterium]